MKKSLIFLFLLMISAVHGFVQDPQSATTNYIIIFINVMSAVLVIVVSMDLYKYAQITRNNPIFVFAYAIIGLLLFSSIINIFYIFAQADFNYLPIYFIDRVIIFLVLVIITAGFTKFRKMLSTKS